MGGCCSKCDKYLVGAPEQKKGGDTPKLARVSHSTSFTKGDTVDVSSGNRPNGRLDIKQSSSNGNLDDSCGKKSKKNEDIQKDSDKQVKESEVLQNSSYGLHENKIPPVNSVDTNEEIEPRDNARVPSSIGTDHTNPKQSANLSNSPVEEETSPPIVKPSETQNDGEPTEVRVENIVPEQSLHSVSVSSEKTESRSSVQTSESGSSTFVGSSSHRASATHSEMNTTQASGTEISNSNNMEKSVSSRMDNLGALQSSSVESSSVQSSSLATSSQVKSSIVETSSAVESSSIEKASRVESSNVEMSSEVKSSCVEMSSSVQSSNMEVMSTVQSSAGDQSSSVQSSAVEMSSSVQSSSVEMSSSVQSSAVEMSSSVQSTAVDNSSSVVSSTDKLSSVRTSAVEMSSSVQSSAVEMSSVKKSSSVQSSNIEESKSTQSSSVEMSNAKMTSERHSNVEVSKSVQSTHFDQSAELQLSNAAQSSSSEISSVSESTSRSSAVLTSKEEVATKKMSSIHASITGGDEGQSIRDETLGADGLPSGITITGINPLKNIEDFQERLTNSGEVENEIQFSSSKIETQKMVSSSASTVIALDGSPPVTKVTENKSEERLSETRVKKAVDGEIIVDEGSSSVHVEDTLRTLTEQGDQINEKELISSQAAEVTLKNGDAVSSKQSSSLVENICGDGSSIQEDDAGFPPPPPDLDDFPPPPKEEDLLPTETLDSSPDGRSSYVTLVTPSGFVSPSRDENDANRRNFTNSLLSDRSPEDVDVTKSLPDQA